MKSVLQKRGAFIAKSMLWSVLLYVAMMLAFNWDDVSNKVRGVNPITVVNSLPSPQVPVIYNPTIIPANISTGVGIIKSIVAIVKDISGITAKF